MYCVAAGRPVVRAVLTSTVQTARDPAAARLWAPASAAATRAAHAAGPRDDPAAHQPSSEAGVALFDGRALDALGWVRINFACPRSMLDDALVRMRRAFG
jgi:hypothetical protein